MNWTRALTEAGPAKRHYGRIVRQGGVGGVRLEKGRVILLSKSWAAEYGPRVVRFNAVAPGPTLTESAEAMFGEDGLNKMMRQAPARCAALPKVIAESIAYPASDRASFIRGAILAADGGRSAI
jgi:NAD(P)-dependent dehydrogenase (short-subunit alcohol dehydrogenase family)